LRDVTVTASLARPCVVPDLCRDSRAASPNARPKAPSGLPRGMRTSAPSCSSPSLQALGARAAAFRSERASLPKCDADHASGSSRCRRASAPCTKLLCSVARRVAP
jgi:hypothetical protein